MTVDQSHPYIPNASPKIRDQMLKDIGVKTIEDLVKTVPSSAFFKGEFSLPIAQSEIEIRQEFANHANNVVSNPGSTFAGAGVYQHFVPAIIDPLVSRGEFLTSYTPYQPEISQGTLTTIMEFQTFTSELTGLPVSNASMYDGSTAAAEAMLLLARAKSDRRIVYVASSIHPDTLTVIRTYADPAGIEIRELPTDPAKLTTVFGAESDLGLSCGVLVQSPNYFGVMEDVETIAKLCHDHQALCGVYVTNPHAFAVYEAPGHQGADFVFGDCSSFGNFPSLGGPGVGFFTAKAEFMRLMPGRITGCTSDSDNKESYCLTLATREQHIRRDKATSNICTNQGVCALRSTIYMSLLGPEGLKEIAEYSYHRARELADLLKTKGFSRIGSDFHNEFVIDYPKAAELIQTTKDFVPGVAVKLPNGKLGLLICVTELNTDEGFQKLLGVL